MVCEGHTIYGLSSSHEPGVFRYIGRTEKTLQERLRGHSTRTNNVEKNEWFSAVRKAGHQVIIEKIAEVAKYYDAADQELRLIKFYSERQLLFNKAPRELFPHLNVPVLRHDQNGKILCRFKSIEKATSGVTIADVKQYCISQELDKDNCRWSFAPLTKAEQECRDKRERQLKAVMAIPKRNRILESVLDARNLILKMDNWFHTTVAYNYPMDKDRHETRYGEFAKDFLEHDHLFC